MKSEECLKFNYSGCGGNENNYDSLLKCKDICMPTLKPLDMHGLIEQFKVYKNEKKLEWNAYSGKELVNSQKRRT